MKVIQNDYTFGDNIFYSDCMNVQIPVKVVA